MARTFGPVALARATKARAEWEGCGRPTLVEFCKRFGYKLQGVREWSAYFGWQAAMPAPPAAADEPKAPPHQAEPEPEQAPPQPSFTARDVPTMLRDFEAVACMALCRIVAGKIPAPAGVVEKAASRLLELAGHVPPKRSDVTVTTQDPRAAARSLFARMTREQLDAIEAALSGPEDACEPPTAPH